MNAIPYRNPGQFESRDDDPVCHAFDAACEAITGDERECAEFANKLIADHYDALAEILTGAYGYGEPAINRFRVLLDDCHSDLNRRASHNLQTRGF